MEILNSLQKELLLEFSGVPDQKNFYLTGGTALAEFYLKHRKSNDLDFFTSKDEIILPFCAKLESSLKAKGFSVERSRGFNSFVELFIGKTSRQTIIHIAQDAPFRFEPTKEVSEFPGLRIDGLKDLASNKLLALFQRATLRDFIDIYFIVNDGHFSREELLALAKEKDPGFELYWLAVAFERINTFSQDAPDIHLLIKPCTLERLKEFFNNWRGQINKNLSE